MEREPKQIILNLDLTECGSDKEIEMASGRRSGDPKDLLLVDPSRPEATKRARRHLTKRQKEIFVQYGFSKALLGEVISAGWDNNNNLFTYRNLQVSCFFLFFLLFTRIAMPCLLISYNYDMSVANEAKCPVPNGVLLPFTTL